MSSQTDRSVLSSRPGREKIRHELEGSRLNAVERSLQTSSLHLPLLIERSRGKALEVFDGACAARRARPNGSTVTTLMGMWQSNRDFGRGRKPPHPCSSELRDSGYERTL